MKRKLPLPIRVIGLILVIIACSLLLIAIYQENQVRLGEKVLSFSPPTGETYEVYLIAKVDRPTQEVVVNGWIKSVEGYTLDFNCVSFDGRCLCFYYNLYLNIFGHFSLGTTQIVARPGDVFYFAVTRDGKLSGTFRVKINPEAPVG